MVNKIYNTYLEKHCSHSPDYSATGPIDAFDENNPYSLFSYIPPELSKRVKSKGVVKYLQMSEEDFERELKPTLVLRRLRTEFWLEYEKKSNCNSTNTLSGRRHQFQLENVYLGICSKEYFYDFVVTNDAAFAWILRCPGDYIVSLTEALQHGVNRLRELLDIPLYKPITNKRSGGFLRNDEGEIIMEVDTKAADILLKSYAMLDIRVKGAIPQKLNIQGMMERKNVNVNLQAGMSRVTNRDVDVDMLDKKLLSIEDLDEKLSLLNNETRSILNEPMFGISDKIELRKFQDIKNDLEREEFEEKSNRN